MNKNMNNMNSDKPETCLLNTNFLSMLRRKKPHNGTPGKRLSVYWLVLEYFLLFCT